MTNAMPIFAAYRNGVELGLIYAVSYTQALARAERRYGRCEVYAVGNVRMDRASNSTKGRSDMSYTHGRRPYETPGFAERRAALIAEYKASQA